MQKVQLLPIDALRKLSVDQQDKLVRQVAGVEQTQKDATKAHTSSFPASGKVAAVIQERLTALLAEGKIASTMTLAGYWESITRVNGKKGEKVTKLNSHVYSCAVAFGTYVRSELITETDYDKNTSQCLELASAISTAVGGDVEHSAVLSAAHELRDRSKDSAKNLQKILDEVREPKAMTLEHAQKALAKIMSSGYLNVVIAMVGSEIAHIEDAEAARSAFFGLITANDMFAVNMVTEAVREADGAIVAVDGKPVTEETRRFSDEVLNAWSAEYAKAQTETSEYDSQPQEQAA